MLAELSVLLGPSVNDLALLRESELVVAVQVGEIVVVPLHLSVHSAVPVEDRRVHGVLSSDSVDSENNGGLGVLIRNLSSLISVSVSVVSVVSVVSSTSLLAVQRQLDGVVTRSVVDVDLVDLIVSLVAPVVVPVLSVSGTVSVIVPSAVVPSARVLDGASQESLVVVEPQRNIIVVVSVVLHVPSALLTVGQLHSVVVTNGHESVLVVSGLQSAVSVHVDVDGNKGLTVSSNILGLGTVVDVGTISEQLLVEVVVLGGGLELVDEVAVGSVLLGSGSSQAKGGGNKKGGGGEFHGRS